MDSFFSFIIGAVIFFIVGILFGRRNKDKVAKVDQMYKKVKDEVKEQVEQAKKKE